MKIIISKNMVEFGPLAKMFNGEPVVKRSSVGTKSIISNKYYGFLPPFLATSIQE